MSDIGGFTLPILSVDPQQPGPALVDYSTAELVTVFGTAQTSPYATAILDVRRFAYTQLWAQTNSIATLVTVTFAWYADSGATQLVGYHRFVTFNNAPIRDTLVNEGPFLVVTFTFAGGGAQLINLYLRGKQTPALSGQGTLTTGVSVVAMQQLAVITYSAVGAGVTFTQTASFCQRGWAMLIVNTDTAGIRVEAKALDIGGTFIDIVVSHLTAAGQLMRGNVLFALPSNLVQLTLTNTTGALANAGASIMIGPTP